MSIRKGPPLNKLAFICLAFFLLSGCAPQYPTVLQAKVSVAQDANPDVFGQPSPVVVSFYQLTNSSAFNASGFFDLYQNAKSSLGSDFISQYQFEVAPGQKYNFNYKLDQKTRYIGVVAAYSKIKSATWHKVIALEPSKHTEELFTVGINKADFDLTINNTSK